MNLSIYYQDIFEKYHNPRQIVRESSERWFSAKMYCPCCLNLHVKKLPNNTKSSDFLCDKCQNRFELKSSKQIFKDVVPDGQFDTMIYTINSSLSPNFFFLNYSNEEWIVKNLLLVPRFFFSASMIKKRKPTIPEGRNAAWVGCDILLKNLPDEGKINIIKNERITNKEHVHKLYNKMIFLNSKKPELRGWTSDVLKCIRDIRKEDFTLKDIYKFKDYLKEQHPYNNNVEAKIRQQLQVLRDHRILLFNSRGVYELL